MKLLSARLPNENEITVNGKMRLSVNDLLEDIAYLPQEPKFAELSIKDNLALYSVEGLQNPFIKEAYDLIMKTLAQKEDTFIESDVVGVSVGQRRALMLINVIAMNKPILILDEPLVAIDEALRKILWEGIKFEAETKIVVVSLHEAEYKKDCKELKTLQIFQIEKKAQLCVIASLKFG